MPLGLPYGNSVPESLRLLGFYTWLCDNDENPGLIESGSKEFFYKADNVTKAQKTMEELSIKLEPMRCVMYCPFSFLSPGRFWTYFDISIDDAGRTELLRCSMYNECSLRIVLSLPLRTLLECGDVGKPSRTVQKLMENEAITCQVWTSLTFPYCLFVALPDDPPIVRRVVCLCKTLLEENENL